MSDQSQNQMDIQQQPPQPNQGGPQVTAFDPNILIQMIQQLQTQFQQLQAQQQAQQQQAPLITLKPAKPPTFSDNANESVDTWLFQMEQYLLAAPCPDNRKIPLAASFLTDHAAVWWRHMFERLTRVKATWRWDDFQKELKLQFRPVDIERTARDRLYKLRQTISVSAYVHEFQNIVLDIPQCRKKTSSTDSYEDSSPTPITG